MRALNYRDYAERYPLLVADVERAGARAREIERRLGNARDRNARRLFIDKFLKSPDAKLYYLFRGIVRCKMLHRYPPDLVISQASTLDLFNREPEAVGHYEKPATTLQSARLITIFGPRKKARQNMVRAVLKAVHEPRPDQYTIKGVPEALKALEQDFRDGFTYAVERDIRRFYQQIRLEGLVNILRPLPRGVVENVVWDGRSDDRTNIDDLSTAVASTGLLPLRGLPQGSACSPIAAEMVVANLLAGLSADIRLRAYADNVIILGRTYHAVAAASEQLESLANAHSAGPLRLKPNDNIINLNSDSFCFLGYEGSYFASARPPHIDWQPRHERLSPIETIIQKRDVSSRELIDALKWCQAVVNTYPLWRGGALWAAEAQCAIHARLAYRKLDNISRYPHCHIIFNYWRDATEMPQELQILLPEAHDYEEKGRQAVLDIVAPWVEQHYPALHVNRTHPTDFSQNIQ